MLREDGPAHAIVSAFKSKRMAARREMDGAEQCCAAKGGILHNAQNLLLVFKFN